MDSTYQSPLVWTPQMRNEFISDALHSEEDRGSVGPYWFNVLSKTHKPDEESLKKANVTSALMNTIFTNPEYRVIGLKMYEILINKIIHNSFTRYHYQKNIVVLLKGGCSYSYLIEKHEDFPYSDIDIIIYINPNLPKDIFTNIKNTLSTIVLQTISQYKRAMDSMFFTNRIAGNCNKQNNELFLSDELITSFKADYKEALQSVSTDDCTYLSPFDKVEYRNAASKHSYIIADSENKEDAVVRIEVPHFENCERIPLKRTPLFCSYNRTIRFNRIPSSDKEVIGSFDLYRIRFNNLYLYKETENVEETMYRENATADFIDISIPDIDDAELIDFWRYGHSEIVNDPFSNIWIMVPNIETMINDLHKMLFVYECPEAKREKREKRYKHLIKCFEQIQLKA
jgi:hypothetical protein